MKILNLLERVKPSAIVAGASGEKLKAEREVDLPDDWIESLRLLVARERNGEIAGLQGGEYLAAEAILDFAEVDPSFRPSPLVAMLLAGILAKAAKGSR